MQLYWDLGQLIVDRQAQHGWGKSVVEQLATELQAEFAGISGFSVQNLWYVRQFYLTYANNSILQPLVGEISWSKHLVIIAKCKDDHERLFYIRQTQRNGWSKNVLIHQIENQAYQKTLFSQQNPSIGIIICKDKGRTTVEFALQDIGKPIGVATYTLSPQLPDDLRRFFPSPDEFVRRIETVTDWLAKG